MGSYQIKVRLTDKAGNVTVSSAVSMSTSEITVTTYSVSPSGDVWAKSKKVTITYPPRQTGFIYQYSVDGGNNWTTVDSGTTAKYTFTKNGNIIARIYDGLNYFNGSTLSVTKVDKTPPSGVSASKVGSTSNSITVKANGTDSESGIAKY